MATVATSSEPASILSRVERLDLMMSYVEEMKGSSNRYHSYINKCASTATSSGTATTATASDGGNSSVNSSPKSLEKRCRPIDDVVMEAQVKGNLIARVDQLEDRLLKLEEDIENQKKRQVEDISPRSRDNKKKHKKGLKSLVRSCVRGNLKTKN